jgi:hypothetical protein
VVTLDLPTPFARGNEQRPGLATGLVERADLAFGVTVAATGMGVATATLGSLQHSAKRFALLVGHDREVETRRCDPWQGRNGAGDAAGDLGPKRAAGHRECNQNLHVSAVNLDVADHA